MVRAIVQCTSLLSSSWLSPTPYFLDQVSRASAPPAEGARMQATKTRIRTRRLACRVRLGGRPRPSKSLWTIQASAGVRARGSGIAELPTLSAPVEPRTGHRKRRLWTEGLECSCSRLQPIRPCHEMLQLSDLASETGQRCCVVLCDCEWSAKARASAASRDPSAGALPRTRLHLDRFCH